MSEKIKLPREVAEALDHEKYMGFHNIVESVVNAGAYEITTNHLVTIRNYFRSDWTLLATAIINGFEVEQTPEDKVREYYLNQKAQVVSEHEFDDPAKAIRYVLELLNIKIDGV